MATPITLLQSDIISLEDYFKALVAEDFEINSLVLETSQNPFDMSRFNEVSNSKGFSYPAMAMLMPVITGDDNGMHDFEARQEMSFAILYSTDESHDDRLAKFKLAQLAAWRFIKYMRRDSKAGRFRMDKMSYKMAAFEYGDDNSVGCWVAFSIITNTNGLIGWQN